GSTTVSVRTSDRAAGRGFGSLEIRTAGLDEPVLSFPMTIEAAPGPASSLSARAARGGRIDLDWAASPTTENLLGYNLYRSAAGEPVKLNDAPIASTSYSDVDTTDGGSYTYFVRAVGTGATVPESTDSSRSSAQADATVPAAGALLPAPGSTDLPADTTLRVGFSEPIDAASLASRFVLRDNAGDAVASSVSYDAASGTATLTPDAPLSAWRIYHAILRGGPGGITDLAGNPLGDDYTWTFSTQSPFVVEPGPAVQEGTTTPIARIGPDGLAMDFGVVPEAQEFTGVLRITNVSAAEQDARLSRLSIDQIRWAHFDSSSATGVTLAPGQSALLNVLTSSLVAGHGAGALRLGLQAGTGLHEDFPTTIAVAPERPPSLTGVARAAGTIGLKWGATPTTTNVRGYDVYRASGDEPFAKLNAEPVTGTAYDDTDTAHGTSYRYVVRAVTTGSPVLQSVDSPVEAVTADSQPSSVQSVAPGAGTSNVAPTTTIRATFDEGIDASTVNSSTLELRNSAGALVNGSVSYDPTTRVATLTPSAPLAAGSTYQAMVKGGASGVADVAGNRLPSDHTWSFATQLPRTIASATTGRSTRIVIGNAVKRLLTSARCRQQGRSRTSSRSRGRMALRCRAASRR
ncbi:MAG TPA: Ig-like domain-containing protein, partial [Actinomycetes bacterium]|nr:Ig-like domain-containing protein [Actinomycetes bacterium]